MAPLTLKGAALPSNQVLHKIGYGILIVQRLGTMSAIDIFAATFTVWTFLLSTACRLRRFKSWLFGYRCGAGTTLSHPQGSRFVPSGFVECGPVHSLHTWLCIYHML